MCKEFGIHFAIRFITVRITTTFTYFSLLTCIPRENFMNAEMRICAKFLQMVTHPEMAFAKMHKQLHHFLSDE